MEKKLLTTQKMTYGDRLKHAIVKSFKGDVSLWQYVGYRLKGHDMLDPEDIARKHWRELDKKLSGEMMTYRVVYTDEACIGYFAYTSWPTPILHSFGINIKHRTPEVREAFIEELRLYMGETYAVMLPVKNTRAIRFFEKRGFSQVQRVRMRKVVVLCRKPS